MATKLKMTMKNHLLHWIDILLMRKRAIPKHIVNRLKKISQRERYRQRNSLNYLVNLLVSLIAYTYQPTKPALHISGNILSANFDLKQNARLTTNPWCELK